MGGEVVAGGLDRRGRRQASLATGLPEVEIDQNDVRGQFPGPYESLGTRQCDADDRYPVALEDFEELIAANPARGFLPKSALSGRAIRELLDGGGEAPAT
ncbi:hypothetical protein ACFYZ8_27945 [Streptomyces sp. NPDC001668]|uniref:hypothetical protein n=1 Tax=unclassified Streptomyces TaxID=2593676 RepID=UPI00369BBAAE